MRFFYTLTLWLYVLVINIISPFNHRAKLWVNGRKKTDKPIISPSDKWIWIHAASLGEFEQGRPLIELIKTTNPDIKILLTFFSPSGYEVRKNYPYADFIMYLPADIPSKVNNFLNYFKPEMAIFIKYEYWYNFINQLVKRKIPFYYVSAIYRQNQIFFKPYGAWFRNHLSKTNHIFCQDIASVDLLNSIGISQSSVSGDTRFDRVAEVTSHPEEFLNILDFIKNSWPIVAGSTWPADENFLLNLMPSLPSHVKLIIAPHLVDADHISQLVLKFSNYQPRLWSSFTAENILNESRVLIIDKIGILMHLYQYSKLAYIGGGFGAGIHNTLEAAAFSKPVIFGPNFSKFKEANDLISNGAAFSFSDGDSLTMIVSRFVSDDKFRSEAAQIAGDYVHNNIGATAFILNKLHI